MLKKLTSLLITLSLIAAANIGYHYYEHRQTGAPPYVIEDLTPPDDPYTWFRDWVRPEGPARVGLQAGHWKNDELPEELERLIGSTGTSGGGTTEVEVNLGIAERTKVLLEKEGVVVEILPATIPERYYADAFIAIHADGSLDRSARGYKLTAPRRDFSGKAESLATHVTDSYGATTQLPWDDNITRNMRGYYAFAWWRYDHALHPMAPAIILETGFLTNTHDRRVIVNTQELAAQGLAEGILHYLRAHKLL